VSSPGTGVATNPEPRVETHLDYLSRKVSDKRRRSLRAGVVDYDHVYACRTGERLDAGTEMSGASVGNNDDVDVQAPNIPPTLGRGP